MTIAFQTDSISPHIVPLAKEVGRYILFDNFRYIYVQEQTIGRKKLGWKDLREIWMFNGTTHKEEKYKWLCGCDVLVTGERTKDVLSIFESRVQEGRLSFYMSERWFKPPFGMLRLLSPRFLRMAWRMMRLMCKENGFYYLPIGKHAAEDMARLVGLFRGDLRCLVSTPIIECDKKPCGSVSGADHCGTGKMFLWGYFVDTGNCAERLVHEPLRCLWIGRMIKLKRVDDIIKAVRIASEKRKIELTLVGTGPEELKLRRMSEGLPVKFEAPVSISHVREVMQQHDVYVFSSNGYDGWGAVVSEALSEGMRVVGSEAPGAPITILPNECLYKEGDVKRLADLLVGDIPWVGIGTWTPENAAKSFMSLVERCKARINHHD